jgi:hypothetical protein
VLLHNPARIEALFCCQFLALLICALIEREVRTGIRQAALDNIALYPEFRDCKAPSTERILEIFATIARHQLHRDGTRIQTFEPELTAQQQQVLDLLGLPHSAYNAAGAINGIPVRDVRNVRWEMGASGFHRLPDHRSAPTAVPASSGTPVYGASDTVGQEVVGGFRGDSWYLPTNRGDRFIMWR